MNLNPTGCSEVSVDLEAPARLAGLYARIFGTWPLADPHATGSI